MDIVCLISWALSIYSVILLIRILLSWFTMFSSAPAALAPGVRVIYELTEPVLRFFRQFIPPIAGMDLSPILIFIIIRLVQGGLGCTSTLI